MPKYLSELHRQVIKRRVDNPCATLKEISSGLDITREWARRILKKHHLPTSHYVAIRGYECLNCGKPTKKNPKFCSYKCYYAYQNVKVRCAYCDREFSKRLSRIKHALYDERYTTGKHFCNNKCKGHWFAEHHGFGIHPENQRKGWVGGKRKYNYGYIRQIRSYTGWTIEKLATYFNANNFTIFRALNENKRRINRMATPQPAECPNRHNHISAWPGFGRERCPYCQKVYVRKAVKNDTN